MQTYEKHFHDACNALIDDLTDAAHSLHTLQHSLQQIVLEVWNQVEKTKRVMELAKNMAKKNPRCVTMLSSIEGHFEKEFLEICEEILLLLALACDGLLHGDPANCQVRYTAANRLESAQEKLEYALDGRE
jgi:hypothetical protein